MTVGDAYDCGVVIWGRVSVGVRANSSLDLQPAWAIAGTRGAVETLSPVVPGGLEPEENASLLLQFTDYNLSSVGLPL